MLDTITKEYAMKFLPGIKAEIAEYLETPGYCEHGVDHWATSGDCACGWCEDGYKRDPYAEAIGRGKFERDRQCLEWLKLLVGSGAGDREVIAYIKRNF
jgi:hypothetical protein